MLSNIIDRDQDNMLSDNIDQDSLILPDNTIFFLLIW